MGKDWSGVLVKIQGLLARDLCLYAVVAATVIRCRIGDYMVVIECLSNDKASRPRGLTNIPYCGEHNISFVV